MPYFSDTGSAPKIVDEIAKRGERMYYTAHLPGSGPFDSGFSVKATRIITTQQYRIVGLTEAAATAAAGVSEDTHSVTTKTAQRTAADKQFQLRVTRDSTSDWTYDTKAKP